MSTLSPTAPSRPLAERALEVLRRCGNPFRNYFARNPDDEVCARYHVPELFSRERSQLLGVVDLYRFAPTTHSEVVPILGSKGAGKTHLLHSIKHGPEGTWQLLVTPGTYQKDSEFLEYLLFQVIDTLLGGGKQKNTRPLEYVGENLVRGLLRSALDGMTDTTRLELFPVPGLGSWTGTLGRWARNLGLGTSQAQERAQWLLDTLARPLPLPFQAGAIRRACEEVGLAPEQAFRVVAEHISSPGASKTQPRPPELGNSGSTAGLMRRHILEGFARSVLLNDEAQLAGFLTYEFAELPFQVRPSRQDLVLALFKSVLAVLQELRIPVVVAFDQLEDLLLARRSDDAHKTAEAFFAGIVQAMHQLDGLAFLIFAERGLWNRFVPSLDGYIQDRLNNPIHLPEHGTLQTLRLEAPPVPIVSRIVEARLRPALEQLPDQAGLPPLFPFSREQVERVARTEPTLRDMLQQFRHLFDHIVYPESGESGPGGWRERDEKRAERSEEQEPEATAGAAAPAMVPTDRIAPRLEAEPVVKSVVIVQAPTPPPAVPPTAETPAPTTAASSGGVAAPATSRPVVGAKAAGSWGELWDQEVRAALRKLAPEGALTGATRELQAGLGGFLQICHEHGVKVGPWRLHHVVPEWTFGDHPTYGVLTIAHWVCRGGQPWKVGVGLFLGRGPAKPRDLGTKLAALEVEPAVLDHLILLRPEDDLSLTGKSKTLWQETERHGRHARLEPVTLEAFASLYAFPRFLTSLTESQPEGQPLPNLADLLQEKCEKLLEQTCLPTQG
jgi:hypothetical protein